MLRFLKREGFDFSILDSQRAYLTPALARQQRLALGAMP